MEEVVATALFFIALMSFGIIAFAYSMSTLVPYIRFSEVTAATAYLKRVSQNSANLMMGDSSTSILRFSFIYGVLSLRPSGLTRISCQGNSPICGDPLYNSTHYVLIYTSPVTGYPPVHVLDRGLAEQSAYLDGTALDAALVYHFSNGGTTSVVADQKVPFSCVNSPQCASSPNITLSIYVLNLTAPAPIAVKQGALSLSVIGTSTTTYRLQTQDFSPWTFTIQDGLQGNNTPLTSTVSFSANSVDVCINVLNVVVAKG